MAEYSNCQILLLAPSSSYLVQKCAYHSQQNFSVEFYFENIISLEDWSKKHFKIWKCYTTYLLQINWIIDSAIKYTVLAHLHKKYCTFSFTLSPAGTDV